MHVVQQSFHTNAHSESAYAATDYDRQLSGEQETDPGHARNEKRGECGRCNKNMKNLAQLLNHIRTNRWKGECAPEGGANAYDAREDSSGSVLAGDESSA